MLRCRTWRSSAETDRAQQSATDAYLSAARIAEERSQAAEKAQKSSVDKKLKPNDRKKSAQQYKALEIEAESAQKTAKVRKAEMDELAAQLRTVNTVLIVLGGMCAFAIVVLHRGDEIARNKPVNYVLDDLADRRFKSLEAGCQNLAEANRVWRVTVEQATSDWKRNAGANSLVTRHDCRISKVPPPHITSNLLPWSVNCDDIALFFFPDHIFVLQQRRYGMLSYESLSTDLTTVNYRGTDAVPSDAKIVGRTWLYVNKNGGPDRRFANNPEMPIALYSQLDIRSAQGFHLCLQVSNTSSAAAFASAIRGYGSRAVSEHGPSDDDRSRSRPQQPSGSANRSAFETLGLTPGASKEEIKGAYHRMVQQYHPDKVATLAPEFRELAERRMKEINAAYEKVRNSG